MTQRLNFKRAYLVSAAATALTLAMSGTVIAQDAELAEDEIVATGIRQSIIDSLAVKKNSTSIVEAISAEDIGKLPDVSIADSLARLPGVTAQRVRGRAQQISIRGLGPDFSIALLNGREQVSSGNNRGIEFDQFPSELISQGLVYKTPDARLATTGVAGAVDLRTVRPLDFSERKINTSAKYVINDNGQLNPDFSDDGYRLFGSYIDQNEDGTFGVSLGITHQSNPTQFFSRELKPGAGDFRTNDAGARFPVDNPRSGAVSRDFKRTSVAGTLQFEPTDNWETTLDVSFSDFEDAGIFRGVETPLAIWAGVDPTAVQTTGSGAFVDSAIYPDVGSILRTDTEGTKAEIFNAGINTKFNITDRLRGTVDISRSSMEKDDIDYESYAGTGGNIFRQVDWDNGGALLPARDPALLDTLSYTFNNNGAYNIQTGLDYTDPSNVVLTDPGGWGQVGFIKEPRIEDELTQLRAEVEYDLDKSFISSVVVGGLLTTRQKSFDSDENFIRVGEGFTQSVPGNANTRQIGIPSSAVIGQTDSGSIGFDIVAYDPSSLLTDGTYLLEKGNFDTEWQVEEDIRTAYMMANIDRDGAIPVRGNVGFQLVDVDQSSSAGGSFVEESYTDFLPSANLSFEVQEDTFIRLGAARSVTRPRMDQLRTGAEPGFNSTLCPDTNGDGLPDTYNGPSNPDVTQTCISIGGGNPLLRPYESTSFDIAAEKYFSEAGAISLAVFSKSIDDYVQDRGVVIESSAAAEALLGSGFVSANPGVSFIAVNGPNNVEKAKLTGVEAALRLPLGDFVDMLEGFGINAAYTYTDSNLEVEGNDIEIPGYSKETFSGEVYFERDGFRARVNTRHRSGFLSEVPQFDGSLTGASALSETVVDAQIGYEWDEGVLEGFGINLEAYNLTDEPFRTQSFINENRDTFISRREDYGTTYNITVSKKF